MVHGILVPLDRQPLSHTGMVACGERFLLLAYLLRRIKADLRQELVRHGEVRINFDCLPQHLNCFCLLHLVQIQHHRFFREAASFRRFTSERQYGNVPLRSRSRRQQGNVNQ